MGLNGSAKKPRSVVIQEQQTSCYQRYMLVLLGLGLGSLLVYIYYTDHIQHAVLPRLMAKVKRTVCSLMTLPCPEEELDWTTHRENLFDISSKEKEAETKPKQSFGVRNKMAEAGPRSRRKIVENARHETAVNDSALRVRSRYPWLRLNRGRGIGPIPTGPILQKVKSIRPKIFSSEKEASKNKKWFDHDSAHPNLVLDDGNGAREYNVNQYVKHQENYDSDLADTWQVKHRSSKPKNNVRTNLRHPDNYKSRENSRYGRDGIKPKQTVGQKLPKKLKKSKTLRSHETPTTDKLHENDLQTTPSTITRIKGVPNFEENRAFEDQNDTAKRNEPKAMNFLKRRNNGRLHQRKQEGMSSRKQKAYPAPVAPKEIDRENAGFREIPKHVFSAKRKQTSKNGNIAVGHRNNANTSHNKSFGISESFQRPNKERSKSKASESTLFLTAQSNTEDKIDEHSREMSRNDGQRDPEKVMETDRKMSHMEGLTLIQNDTTSTREPLGLGPEWNGKSLKAFLADRTSYSIQSDYDYLQQHLLSGGMNLTMMSNRHWPEEMRFDYREFYLDPPLEIINQAASHVTSHVVLLEPRPSYMVGEVLKLRVDVYNGNGDALKRGGDEVRVWLVERSKGASLAGIVTDLNNGSYLAELQLKWTGIQKIQAELTFSREALRAHDYLRHVTKVMRYVAGGFSKDAISEATMCSPFPTIPGYDELCNFTHPVYGQAWFCGKPRKPELQCSDWVSIRDMEFIAPLPLTQAEKDLLERLRKPPHLRLIPAASGLSVHVTSGRAQMPEKSCSRTNLGDTWNLNKPRGFMLHGQWIRTDCASSRVDPALESNCLTNTTLTFAGDSTLLQFFTDLITRTGCTPIESHAQNWHRPRACVKPDTGFQMSWALHGYPVHPVSDHWALRTDFREVTDLLDAIPVDEPVDDHSGNGAQRQTGGNEQQQDRQQHLQERTQQHHLEEVQQQQQQHQRLQYHQQHHQHQQNLLQHQQTLLQNQQQEELLKHQQHIQPPNKQRHVVLITLYIHLSIHHINVFGDRVRAARRATQRLLERSPSTLVLLRGPHTAYYGWPPHLGGDMMGQLMRKMIVEEFRPLRDKVVYLDFWDMTVAMENSNFHPDPAINTAMLNFMLQHVCAK